MSLIERFRSNEPITEYELQIEIDHYERIIIEYEENDVYSGDSYYQEALETFNTLIDIKKSLNYS